MSGFRFRSLGLRAQGLGHVHKAFFGSRALKKSGFGVWILARNAGCLAMDESLRV